GDVDRLAAVLSDLAEKNILAAEDMKRGQQRLKAMQGAQTALQEAMSSDDREALKRALQEAEAAQLQGPLREEAGKKLQESEAACELEAALKEADQMEAAVPLPGEANARPQPPEG
ncbi:unnamed protein product, partial [Effrenium voratum]